MSFRILDGRENEGLVTEGRGGGFLISGCKLAVGSKDCWLGKYEGASFQEAKMDLSSCGVNDEEAAF